MKPFNIIILFFLFLLSQGFTQQPVNQFGELISPSSNETNPPREITASVNGFNVDITWRAPLPEGAREIVYDDGTAEGNISIGAQTDGEIAARFTPNAYPTTLVQVVVQFSGSAVASTTTDLIIYNGNDITGPATTLLTQQYAITQRGSFAVIDVESAGIQIDADDFFVSFSEGNGETMNLAWDTSSPTAGRAWINAPGLGFPWQPFGNINPTFDNNLLVRAVVREGVGPDARVAILEANGSSTPLTITEYKELLAANKQVCSLSGAVYIDGSTVPAITAAPIKNVGEVKYGLSGSTLTFLNGYNIYRSDDGGANFSLLASTDSITTSYSDTTARRDVEVLYYLTAVYSGGEGIPSDTVSVLVAGVIESIAEHTTPEFRTAVTNEGTIGMLNYFGGLPGFEWPLGTNQLFDGAIMVGISPDQVSDGARVIMMGGQNQFDADFTFATNIDTLSFTPDETIYRTSYNDSNHPNSPQADDGPNTPLSIKVIQTTYSYTDADNSGYLIMKIQVVNTGSATLNNVLVGQCLDWDVNAFSSNTGDMIFDNFQIPGENNGNPFIVEFARVFDDSGPVPYLGAVPLSQSVFRSSRILDYTNEVVVSGPSPLSEANKYNYMLWRNPTDPFGDPFGPADKLLLYSMGGGADGDTIPEKGFTILPGDSITTGVAIVGGNNTADFLNNGKAALQKWSDLGNDISAFWRLVVGIEDGPVRGAPSEYMLEQNYPNPFNPTTTIAYALEEAADVELTVYNMLGQKVRALVNMQQNAGYQSIQWDGRNDRGEAVTSGIYIYKLTANEFVASRKLVLIR